MTHTTVLVDPSLAATRPADPVFVDDPSTTPFHLMTRPVARARQHHPRAGHRRAEPVAVPGLAELADHRAALGVLAAQPVGLLERMIAGAIDAAPRSVSTRGSPRWPPSGWRRCAPPDPTVAISARTHGSMPRRSRRWCRATTIRSLSIPTARATCTPHGWSMPAPPPCCAARSSPASAEGAEAAVRRRPVGRPRRRRGRTARRACATAPASERCSANGSSGGWSTPVSAPAPDIARRHAAVDGSGRRRLDGLHAARALGSRRPDRPGRRPVRLNATIDAIGDLLLAESVHHQAAGNPARPSRRSPRWTAG